jgi:hypothetical protein
MGEISNGSGSPADMRSKNSSMGLMSPLDDEPVQLEMKKPSVSKANRYQVSEEDELIENDDINLDLIEEELDNKRPAPKPKVEAKEVAKVPIDPADESWGVESSDKQEALPPNLDPIIDHDFEPEAVQKSKKRDEARDLAMPPPKVEEEKPSYIPKKVPIIDP